MTEMEEMTFFTPYLELGEQVLWRGRPGKGKLVMAQDAFMIPFSILWCSFAIFWEATVLLSDGPMIMKLWGIPFVCVGLYLVFGRFLWTAHRRKQTAYAITDRKIIFRKGNKVEILDRTNLPAIHVEIFKDGSGTILFGQEWNYHRHSGRFAFPAPGIWTLENVPDAMNVYQFLVNRQ